MSIWKQFGISFYQIKKIAAFRILKISKAIVYLFFLTLFLMIPVLVNAFINDPIIDSNLISNSIDTYGFSKYVLTIVTIPFIYLTITGLIFIFVSFLAGCGLLLAKTLKKRVDYKQVWVISSYAITTPTLSLSVIELLFPALPFTKWGLLILSLLFLLGAIRYLPKSQK
ncbi:DUF1189 domain-containing protein [Aquibacillus sp. 3ASR75-11]|uniref:DUF1189 domain-containing protein n=1 Tax=Terrihalobacillus insolitus TaxID=2950438 RepID=A0A9X4AM19_9BACI|nr:DUF1189 family protein [Terrihalobacillus insolitus]MDC3413374.1 DUF1189 domain-containing protein [Terrihalobacillus insolitus]MDC3424957.1 DUF1189 domain-containing protein [Terrihalobacillus insolitus]